MNIEFLSLKEYSDLREDYIKGNEGSLPIGPCDTVSPCLRDSFAVCNGCPFYRYNKDTAHMTDEEEYEYGKEEVLLIMALKGR